MELAWDMNRSSPTWEQRYWDNVSLIKFISLNKLNLYSITGKGTEYRLMLFPWRSSFQRNIKTWVMINECEIVKIEGSSKAIKKVKNEYHKSVFEWMQSIHTKPSSSECPLHGGPHIAFDCHNFGTSPRKWISCQPQLQVEQIEIFGSFYLHPLH